MCAGSPIAGTSSNSPSPPDHEFETDTHNGVGGLLRGSFRPTAGIVARRTYLRHRQTVLFATHAPSRSVWKA
jgi:hypothetical protein